MINYNLLFRISTSDASLRFDCYNVYDVHAPFSVIDSFYVPPLEEAFGQVLEPSQDELFNMYKLVLLNRKTTQLISPRSAKRKRTK